QKAALGLASRDPLAFLCPAKGAENGESKMTTKTKSQPSQMSMFGAFAEAEFDAKTEHMPSTMEMAIPFYRSIIERYHSAMLVGDPKVAAAIQLEAQALAVRLNGGTNFNMKGNPETAVCYVLERFTAARH